MPTYMRIQSFAPHLCDVEGHVAAADRESHLCMRAHVAALQPGEDEPDGGRGGAGHAGLALHRETREVKPWGKDGDKGVYSAAVQSYSQERTTSLGGGEGQQHREDWKAASRATPQHATDYAL